MSETDDEEVLRVDGEAVDQTRELAADADRVIVKAGTNSLTDAESNLDDAKLDKLVDDLVDLLNRDKEVILVSSGAVGAGKGLVGNGHETIEELKRCRRWANPT